MFNFLWNCVQKHKIINLCFMEKLHKIMLKQMHHKKSVEAYILLQRKKEK